MEAWLRGDLLHLQNQEIRSIRACKKMAGRNKSRVSWLSLVKVEAESTLSLVMMEPYERKIVCKYQQSHCKLAIMFCCFFPSPDTCIGLIVLMLLYTCVIYLPPHVYHLVHLSGLI